MIVVNSIAQVVFTISLIRFGYMCYLRMTYISHFAAIMNSIIVTFDFNYIVLLFIIILFYYYSIIIICYII